MLSLERSNATKYTALNMLFHNWSIHRNDECIAVGRLHIGKYQKIMKTQFGMHL